MNLLQTVLDNYPEPELLARIDWLAEIREKCAAGSWKEGAKLLQMVTEDKPRFNKEEQALLFVRDYLWNELLEQDRYLEASALAWSRGLFEQRPVHMKRVFDVIRDNDKIILLGASGLSKCLGPEVPVLMFDGSIKPASQVKEGDQLMGDDSKPRNVLSAHSGYGPMYDIIPKSGSGIEWRCNDEHILSLISSNGEIVDVCLKDYLLWPKDKKDNYFQYQLPESGWCHWFPFQVKPIGDGEYFGFEIDGNRRFLLGDFTVTHNTYGAAASVSLDFMRDPPNTSIKFGSVNDTNLKGNLWSNLRTFQDQALFPQDLHPNETRMRMRPEGCRPDCGLDAILFSKQTGSTGKIKGFHPKPFRLEPHHKYGNLTILRILLDETQELPAGVKSDLGSPTSTMEKGNGHVKIILTCNPIDEGAWVVQMAQPPGGWEEDKIDKLKCWEANGWTVLRLDGADFENVKYSKTVYPGFLTREAYDGYMRDGLPTPDWHIFGRGWPPPGRASETVVPSTWFDKSKGEPIFSGKVDDIMGADLAFKNDKGILAVGRYGLASGWYDWEGNEHRFISRKNVNQFEYRHCCVLDRLITLKAKDPTGVAEEIKVWAESLGIEPDHCVLDETGVGFGVVSHLQKYWGAVVGINWKQKATERKILVEDKWPANQQCYGIVSEMYWTLRQWMDLQVKGFFINPNCEGWALLRSQLTNRGHKKRGMLNEVESKESYTKRNPSPDESDATVMMAFVPRLLGLPLPARLDESARVTRSKGKKATTFKTADRPVSQGPQWASPRLQGRTEVRLPTHLQL